jgi:hypothetical protein
MRWIAMSQIDDFNIDEAAVHFIPGTFRISEMFNRIEAEVAAIGPFSLVIVDTDDGVVELHWQGKFRGPDFQPLTFQLRQVTHERLKDTKGRLIPSVVAGFLSDAAQEDMAAAARAHENQVLAAYASTPSASLADVARSLGWLTKSDQPEKMKVKRAREKLRSAKLITIERDHVEITEKGEKVLAVTAKAQTEAVNTARHSVTA